MKYEYLGFESLVSLHGKELWMAYFEDQTNYPGWIPEYTTLDTNPKKGKMWLSPDLDEKPIEELRKIGVIIFYICFEDKSYQFPLKYFKDGAGYYVLDRVGLILGSSEKEVRNGVKEVTSTLIEEAYELKRYKTVRWYLGVMLEYDSVYIEELKEKKPEMFV